MPGYLKFLIITILALVTGGLCVEFMMFHSPYYAVGLLSLWPIGTMLFSKEFRQLFNWKPILLVAYLFAIVIIDENYGHNVSFVFTFLPVIPVVFSIIIMHIAIYAHQN